MGDWRELKDWKNKSKSPLVSSRQKRNRILHQFLAHFGKLETNELRLAALREIAEMKFVVSADAGNRKVKREKFDARKNNYYRLRGPCRVCLSPANVRHHVIQLSNGGSNSSDNLMRLCNGCHEAVHPWMKRS